MVHVAGDGPPRESRKGEIVEKRNEILAMAIKAVLILDTLGRRSAIGYLRKRGFTPAETVDIVIRRRCTMVDGSSITLVRP
jgi:hypothetical protein